MKTKNKKYVYEVILKHKKTNKIKKSFTYVDKPIKNYDIGQLFCGKKGIAFDDFNSDDYIIVDFKEYYKKGV